MMDEKKRTKLLAGLLIAAISVYGGRSFVSSTFLDPIQKASARKKSVESALEKLQQEAFNLRRSENQLAEWRSISLPEDALTAQRLYREWIENLALKCGFTVQSVVPAGKNEQKERYLTVAVDLSGETDLAGLSRFMFLFDQAAALHRITLLKVNSTGSQGNPRLEVTLTAEGMSVFSSGARNELFSRTQLDSAVTETATVLNVRSTDEFPAEAPFYVRVNRELIQVTENSDTRWTVERASFGTRAAAHAAEAVIELLPVLWDRRDQTLDQYNRLLAASPFALPTPPRTFAPRLTGLSDKTIKPGESVQLTVKADGHNPDLGTPTFQLQEPVAGVELNSATGELVWTTPSDIAAGKYTATIVMIQPEAPDQKVESRVSITVRVPNQAPVITAPESAIVIRGQEFRLKVSATDDGPAEKLTFSLGSSALTGLTIDPKSGEMKWTPPTSFKPGAYDVEVKVTDAGAEPQAASRRIRLELKDDSAILTLLTGAVSKDDVWYAWFRNKGTGVRQELKIGERLKVAEIDAEIIAIENRSILLKDAAGTWRVALGNSIRQRTLLTPAATAEPVSPPAAARAAEDTALTPVSLPQQPPVSTGDSINTLPEE